MDPDWDEVGRVLLPPPGPHQLPTQVSTCAFDTHQELLWAGNELGRVTSFYGTELQKYTSFRAHPPQDGPVRQVLFHAKGVLVLGSRSVHFAMRRGPCIWHLSDAGFQDLRCMSFASKGTNEILVAGLQDTMYVIDVNKGEILKQIPTEHQYTLMRQSRHICAATTDGSVDIMDTVTLQLVKTWKAHSSFISDMDAQHDFIVTCGASFKQQAAQAYMLDPFVNVFDLKNMKPISPLSFPPGAAFVRLHPRMLTTSLVVSQQGQIHIVDLLNPNTSNVRHANVLSYLSMVEIAPSGEAIVLADTEGCMHLWGSPSRFQFSGMQMPTEFADEEQSPPPSNWDSETPLNSVGVPYYRDVLLSAWPSNIMSDVGAPPIKWDQNFLSTLKATEYGLYGRNNRAVRRNQVENTRTLEQLPNDLQAPKFLSEKARESARSSAPPPTVEVTIEEVANQLSNTELASLKPEVPAMYRNVEIKYSKFGVDDFDFGYYNKTTHPGLENQIPNAYANSLLQVMHYTPLLRNMALQHAATACLNDQCLLCELAYVFDMLQKAEASTCQASNMLKALSHQPQAGPLGLLEEEVHSPSLANMIQGLTRFLMDRVSQDYRSITPTSTALEEEVFGVTTPLDPDQLVARVLTTSATSSMRCMHCRNETTRDGSTFVNDLIYPVQKPPQRGVRPTRTTFSQVLKLSIEKETTSRGWCNKCTRYQPLQTRRTIQSIPAVLVLNTAISTMEHRRLWAAPGFLPEEIGIIVDQGQFFCYDGDDLKLHLQRGIHDIAVYSLAGMSVHIEGGESQKPHLVGVANVGLSEPIAQAGSSNSSSKWHLFNDFSVRSVSTAEALAFNSSWKTPAVLVYHLRTANNHSDDSWKSKIDTSVLFADMNSHPGDRSYRLLDPVTEMPVAGTIVALDTEFVSLQGPEIQMNAEGHQETIRPLQYGLARVSVVRGHGEDEGLAFLDDYISIKEKVADYLTTYSGIKPEDLDPRNTKHNLVSLKVAYKKLWVLLNLGCRFLGHGLKQDFRVINIQVPKAQVIDTIELFFLQARLRKLSLAFLAWWLLKEDIQLETHDSIEDARTALKLYRKWDEYTNAGVLEQILQEVYSVGRDMNFRAPKRDTALVKRTDTPPVPIEGGPGPSTPVRRAGAGATVGLGSVPPAWAPGKASPLK